MGFTRIDQGFDNTVECHYNTVQYCKIFHIALRGLVRNINQSVRSQITYSEDMYAHLIFVLIPAMLC